MKHYLLLLTVTIFLLTDPALSQTGTQSQWAWMKGSSTCCSDGYYGSIGLENSLNNPIARGDGQLFKDANGDIWLFGGFSYMPAPMWWYFNDVWKFNTATNNWILMKGSDAVNQAGIYNTMGVESASSTPGARARFASWTDANGNFWLFGGDGYDQNGSWGDLNDFWKFDPITRNWTWMGGSAFIKSAGTQGMIGEGSTSFIPAARSGAASWTDPQGNFWLYGGEYYELNTSYMDLWKYSPASQQWTWVNGAIGWFQSAPVYGTQHVFSSSNTPGTRSYSHSWSDATGNLYLYGGTPYNSWPVTRFSDMWKYNPLLNQWAWVNGSTSLNQSATAGTPGTPDVNNHPGGRLTRAFTKDNQGNFLLFGGSGYFTGNNVQLLNDLWKYDPLIDQWTWVKGGQVNANGVYGTQGLPDPSNNPGSRSGAMMCAATPGNVWLFGGSGYSDFSSWSELNDLWKLSALSVVPTRLLTFSCRRNMAVNDLQWSATNLADTRKFIVERSWNQAQYKAIAEVSANVSRELYEFADPLQMHTGCVVYYRLKMVEADGSFRYSNIVAVKAAGDQVTVYPNPASDHIVVTFSQTDFACDRYEVIDMIGNTIIKSPQINIQYAGKIKIDVAALAKGQYHLKLSGRSSWVQSRFIKL